jgi:hypothetical protein
MGVEKKKQVWDGSVVKRKESSTAGINLGG